MWIEQVYLQGFGKLKAKEIHFSKNLNLLFGFNESGKTTLAYFLLNSLGDLGEELSRYEPWDTSKFGGEIKIFNKHIKVDFHSGNHSPQYKRKMLEAVGFIFEDETLDISKGIDTALEYVLRNLL